MLHDTIAAQRRFLAQQRAAEYHNSDENFITIGSAEDERIIRKLNKKVVGTKKADSIKEESKEEAENDELKLCLTIALDEDKEVDYEILDRNCDMGTRENFFLLVDDAHESPRENKHAGVSVHYDHAVHYSSLVTSMYRVIFCLGILLLDDRENLRFVVAQVMTEYNVAHIGLECSSGISSASATIDIMQTSSDAANWIAF
ncbi:hypothetical protein Tco_0071635 [Tanacetum coccineum]